MFPQMIKGTGVSADPPNLVTPGFRLFGGFRGRKHRNERTALEALVERHGALGGRKDRVILAHSDALAWPELGAALTHDDVAGDRILTTEQFHAKTTARAVAAVAG